MKIRILGNSLRLRLNVPEVQEIMESGKVSDHIGFGDSQLYYSLRFMEQDHISATFDGSEITVYLPLQDGRRWATTDQVGLEGRQQLKGSETLKILVEKDFTCLIPREAEDAGKLFPNPEATQSGT